MGKLQCIEFFVAVADAAGTVKDLQSVFFCHFEQIGCVNELHIEWGFLTHKDSVHGYERRCMLACHAVPVNECFGERQFFKISLNDTCLNEQVGLL